MLTAEEQRTRFAAACIPLCYLVRPERRARKPTGMEHFSESACFHRLRNLFWPIGDTQFASYLTQQEKDALSEFERVYQSLPWCVIATHLHISELPDDNLSPLVPFGQRLLQLIEPRAERPSRFGSLRRLFEFLRLPHLRKIT